MLGCLNAKMLAFLASGLTLVVLVALLFSGLFPRVMIGSEGFDLLIKRCNKHTIYTKNYDVDFFKHFTIRVSLYCLVLLYFQKTYFTDSRTRGGIKSMIDKDILQMPKIKNSCLACRFFFPASSLIIGKLFFFQKPLSYFWSGGHLNQQLQSILLFLFLYWSTCYYVFS